MDQSQDFKSIQDEIQKSLISAVKSVNRIAAEDLAFQRTVNPEAADQLDEKTSRLLGLSTRLLQSAAKACRLKAPTLEDAEDIDMNWRAVVDVVDTVLEKADTAIDEYTGLVKRKAPPNADSNSKAKKPKASKVIRYANVQKPQQYFEVQPDNFPKGPWKPILSKKPNATVSLEKSLNKFINDEGTTQYKHPYETEISTMQYPDRVFEASEPIPYQPVDTTTAIWVDTYDGVLEMLKELKEAKEIAVDLEHHDFRTYIGLVSLMQISTREKDWVVDTLQPWRQKLEVLNEVFTDPTVIKVFHGAYMDMVWLQRDLGLYVNGLFDTFFACEALMYPGKGLAFLLSKFVNFDADKQYQLADWRIRPLPDEMMYYARSDTHYLLYIYDQIRNELIKSSNRNIQAADLIGRTLEKSRELSLSRYEHPEFNEKTGEGSRGWYGYALKNSHLGFSSEQFAVFRAIWKWRDETARKEDESPNYALTPTILVDLSRANPPDAKALHSLLPVWPPLAKQRVDQIWSTIQEVKAEGGPSLLRFFAALASESTQKATGTASKVDSNQPQPTETLEATVTRLPKSILFGDVAVSSLWEPKPAVEEQEDRFPFPWQRFVDKNASVVEVEEVIPPPSMTNTPKKEVTSTSPVKVVQVPDEEFTLKQGRKRKSEAMELEDTSEDSALSGSESDSSNEQSKVDEDDTIMVEEDAPQKSKKDSKRERKLQKKAQKKRREELRNQRRTAKLARKQEREKTNAETKDTKSYQAVPFDYGKASSVLHAKRDDTAVPVTEDKKKVFDPYSKSGDGELKGARKMPPIRGEKSATFRN